MSDSAAGPVPGAAPVLEVRAVDKHFAGVHALRAVDFQLRAGEVHALVGENGAGKSTLIKVMTGVYSADGGEVRFQGEPVSFASPLAAQMAGISTIYQEVNLIPMMSVADNLFLNREPRRAGLIDQRRLRRDATRILHEYGVDVNVARPLRSLGLGAQQMVAIARSVQLDARVVIMDEPTSSLEYREVARLLDVVRRLRDAGVAIVYVSHRLDELFLICDRVTVMRDGRVVGVRDIAELDRLSLISLMLGRDIGQVRREGVTAFDAKRGEGADSSLVPVLSVEGLSRRNQLDAISLQIRPGEVVGLGGLLGSGRSETAKGIAGALKTDAGQVSVAGTPLHRNSTKAAIKAGVVMLPEDRKTEGIIPNLSVRENIVLAALPRLSRLGLVNKAKQDEVVKMFMDRLKIKASGPEQKVVELSGGNQQKVMLARWLCLNPKVLLLDEPTRGIDVGAKGELQSLIDELAADGLGVLLISSELEELIEGSDRVVVLKEGRVVGELKGDDVSEDALMSTLAAGPSADGLSQEEPAANVRSTDGVQP